MTDAIIRYAIMAGQSAAEYDIAHNQRGYHRDQSNSPFYRDAYDATIKAIDSGLILPNYRSTSYECDIALIRTLLDDKD